MELILGHLHFCFLPSLPVRCCWLSVFQARHSPFSGCETGMWLGLPRKPVEFTQSIYAVFTSLRFSGTECLQGARKPSFYRSTVCVSNRTDTKKICNYLCAQAKCYQPRKSWPAQAVFMPSIPK